ncbi:hypothetical protein ACFLXT_03565 [Chloroflexota bacterium]
MGTNEVTLKVLSPRGEIEAIPQVSLSPSLGDLSRKKIGILYNGKTGGETLLPYIEEALRKRVSDIEFRKWTIVFNQAPEVKEPGLKELADYADGVIALMGD